MDFSLWSGFSLSILLGALIGIQREMKIQKENINSFAGFRANIFLSLLGFIIGYLSVYVFNLKDLLLVGFIFIFSFAIVSYRISVKLNPKEISITNVLVSVFVFIVGILISFKLYYFSVFMIFVISIILYLSDKMHKLAKKLKKEEFLATLKFGIVSAIILPILPNKNYSPLDLPYFGNLFRNQNFISYDILVKLDIFNFFNIWLMVVFVSGIGYFGYILMKILGAQKGVEVTGFVGGFMSSTALTMDFSQESKRIKILFKPLVIGALIACSTMFIRILFEVWVLNEDLVLFVFGPLFVMGFFGYLISFFIFFNTKERNYKKIELHSPFTLGPALKFAVFFVFILFITRIFSIFLGDKGIYYVSFLSGITDVDAITISLSNLAKTGQISQSIAAIGIIIASIANSLFKIGVAFYFGSRIFFKYFTYSFLGIFSAGILYVFFMM